ncbi:MAG: DNA polymerase III subunit delta [Chloroflexi bacterium]|nr:DNA polymerase III subunit delta [Chloroflexota bacterium]MBV9897812.1 DNA polymerase III subunit delta [Chloroflexota bacterium]
MNSTGGYVYVLYGEDAFGRDEAVQTLKDRMRALPAGDHNLTELGPDTTVAGLRQAADVVPFLAERRMVIVRGLLSRLSGRTPRRAARSRKPLEAGADELQLLLDYLPDLPQTTSLVFVEDGRINPDALTKAIPRGRAHLREYGRVIDVVDWVRKRARLVGVDMDEGAVRELASLGGTDLRRLDSELHKLGDYAAGRTVTRADVREMVVSRDIAVWSLLDGLSERRLDKALGALHALYAQGEPPEALLGRDIAPHYRRLMVARELALLSRAERAAVDVASLGLNPATLPRWTEQASAFERSELEQSLAVLLELDRHIKLGETEPEPSLEVAVARLCTRLGD